jgi:hypothetical protein
MVSGGRTAFPSLGRAERLAVLVFCWLLPVGIRARQRGEWAADLSVLRAGERYRYLFWAGWTLPALHAVARRGGLAGGGGPAVVLGASGAVRVLTRTVLVGLGWPVISWLVTVPGLYGLKSAFGAELSAESTGWGYWALFVPLVLLWFGALVAFAGGPYLGGALGLAAVLAGLTLRGASSRLRAAASVAGAVAAGSCLAVLLTPTTNPMIGLDLESSYSTGAMGTVAVALGLTANGLTRRTRVALVLIGLGGLAVLVTQHTSMGTAMRIWFLD